jgi:CRP/FNR family cyclic AMP-dependent transcriptional regulator
MFDNLRERRRRIEALRARIPLVSGCTDEQLARIDNLGAPIDVRPGTTLTSEGSIGRELFLVLGGAAVARHGGVAVGEIVPGSVAGEMALLDGTVRSATVVATTPMQLRVLSAQELTELLRVAPELEPELRQVAAERRVALDFVDAR